MSASLAGNDYIKNISNIGLKTSIELIHQYKNFKISMKF